MLTYKEKVMDSKTVNSKTQWKKTWKVGLNCRNIVIYN